MTPPRKRRKRKPDKRMNVEVYVTRGLREAVAFANEREGGGEATDLEVRHWAQAQADLAAAKLVTDYMVATGK